MFLNFVPTNIDRLYRFGKEGNIEPLDIVVDEAEVFEADKYHEDSINILKMVVVHYQDLKTCQMRKYFCPYFLKTIVTQT